MSDVVHYNSFAKSKFNNIDDLVMGRAGKTRRYYGEIGKLFISRAFKKHIFHFTDISVRDVVLHLGNYSLVWEQLLSVYPRVITETLLE